MIRSKVILAEVQPQKGLMPYSQIEIYLHIMLFVCSLCSHTFPNQIQYLDKTDGKIPLCVCMHRWVEAHSWRINRSLSIADLENVNKGKRTPADWLGIVSCGVKMCKSSHSMCNWTTKMIGIIEIYYKYWPQVAIFLIAVKCFLLSCVHWPTFILIWLYKALGWYRVVQEWDLKPKKSV